MKHQKLAVSKNFIGLLSTFLATYFASLHFPMGDTHFIGCALVAFLGWFLSFWFLNVEKDALWQSLSILAAVFTSFVLFWSGLLFNSGALGGVISFILIAGAFAIGPMIILAALYYLGKFVEVIE